MKNISGIVRQVEDLLKHVSHDKQVYMFFGHPDQPDYRRPYVHIGHGEFAWAYEDAVDGYTIRELLMNCYAADLVFVEAGHMTYEGDKIVYKALVSNM